MALLSISSIVYASDYIEEAEELKSLNLFNGSDRGFELDRAPTRVEAAAMLVKFLGKEQEATQNQFSHPFTDVPTWANPYVGYLYHQGITKGLNATTFGSKANISARDFTVFILKSLGYQSNDFEYQNTLDFAAALRLVTPYEASTLKDSPFSRGHMAHIAYNALATKLKDDTKLLKDVLVESGTIDTKTIENTSLASSYHAEINQTESEIIEFNDDFFKLRIKPVNARKTSTDTYFEVANGLPVCNDHNLEVEISFFKDNQFIYKSNTITGLYTSEEGRLMGHGIYIPDISYNKIKISVVPITEENSNSHIKITHYSINELKSIEESIKNSYGFIAPNPLELSDKISTSYFNTWISMFASKKYAWNDSETPYVFKAYFHISPKTNCTITVNNEATSSSMVKFSESTGKIDLPLLKSNEFYAFILYNLSREITEIIVIDK